LRNQDVNLKIINLIDYKQQKNNIDNYLVVKKSESELVISSYKTKAVYGQKRIRIRSHKILNAIRALKSGWLLQTDKGMKVDMSNLSYYIRLMPFGERRLTETDYCKITIFHIQTLSNPLQKIIELSKHRGTSPNTLHNSYNFDKN
jgi:hypothetical protein